MSEIEDTKTRDAVYAERNLAVLAFLRESDYDCGYYYPEIEQYGMPVVWAATPAGDVSWHIPRRYIPDWLDRERREYDGYTTIEKNRRVAKLLGIEQAFVQSNVATHGFPNTLTD